MNEINLRGVSLKNEKPNKIRQEGFIPCNLYGNNIKNQQFKVRNGDFIKAYKEAGESSLVNLQIDNGPVLKCLIKEVQLNVVNEDFLHIDFYQVDMNETVITEVPLNLVGESNAVKSLNGILNINMSELEVECLPSKLVHGIDVDISKLKDLHDTITIGDIKMPEGVTAVQKSEEIIISINLAQKENEEENDKDVTDVEVATEKKDDKKDDEKKSE